ncbi:MAG: DUF4097 domain-containing protein [Lachnospiraceae bacterium]|nr:DUF4097 domain-containing protein [Lachnospiraceae bacterium]
MKNFTKIALIITLILAIAGGTLCAVGMGIGFQFSDFWDEVKTGEFSIGPLRHIPYIRYHNDDFDLEDDQAGKMSWTSQKTENFQFAWKDMKKIEIDADYAGISIEEDTAGDKENLYLDVEYRKKDHRRQLKVVMDGETLKIEDQGTWRIRNDESVRITMRVPKELMESGYLKKIEVDQDAGYLHVDTPLTAEEIQLNIDAGECFVAEKMTAAKKISAEIDAGRMELNELETEELEMSAGIGELYTSQVQAEKIEISCGIGSVEVEVAGKESDYSYEISCDVGNLQVGDHDYSGFGSERTIKNPGKKKMEIDCGVGDVDISFVL